MANAKISELPSGLNQRCLNKRQAAEYLGVSINTFTRMIDADKAPKPIQISPRRLVWDRELLDEFISSQR